MMNEYFVWLQYHAENKNKNKKDTGIIFGIGMLF
jgi:hypothetical protein